MNRLTSRAVSAAERLRLHRTGVGRAASVRRIERLSDQHLVHVALTESPYELITSAPPGSHFEPGDTVHVEALQPMWFDADGRRIGIRA